MVRKAHPVVRKAHPVIREGSVVLCGGPREVRRPTRRYVRGREAHPEL